MDELLAEFIAETRETLEAASGAIVEWEAHPGDRERLDTIFRFIHTVKGSCGFLDLPRLGALSHAAEEALTAVRSGQRPADKALIDAVLAVIDRIAALVERLDQNEAIDGGDGGDDDDLLAALERRQSHEHSGRTDTDAADHSAGEAVHNRATPARSIRVPVELLDRLMGGVSDLVLARNELARQLRTAPGRHPLDFAFERMSSCVAEMRDAITWTRMQRIESLFAALPRLVRDLSAELGKSVALDIEGGDVELDREMIEMLRDPLTHIVRNAIDHGIEAKAERIGAGKPATGTLEVSARQSGNQIHIVIRDDGHGIDTARLLETAIAGGSDAAKTIRPGSDEAIDLIFRPGLSTAAAPNEISGRGVGMDVVRANIERIGGTIEIDSEFGKGTQITLSVPLTLTIIPALIAGAGDHLFAIPRPAIDEIIDLGKRVARIEKLGGGELAVLRDGRIPLVRLSALLGEEAREDDDKLIVVRPGRKQRYALLVSSVRDHEELVAKPAAPGVMQAGIYAGTALPDNGRPVLLLDIAGIADRAGLELDRIASAERRPEPERPTTEALVFDDLDGVRRAVRLSVIERILACDVAAITEQAGQLRIVIGDRILPVLASSALPANGEIRLLRIGDGRRDLVYAIGGGSDVVQLPENFEPAARTGRIAGVALIEGGPVEILDAHALLSEISRDTGASGARPLCRILAADDHWAREILAPMVEASGYDVDFGGDGRGKGPDRPAALVIDVDGRESDVESGARVLRLSDRAEPLAGEVNRYDRAAIARVLREGARRAGGSA